MSIAEHRDTSARPAAVPGTIELTNRSVKLQRRIVLLLTVAASATPTWASSWASTSSPGSG
jgi:hypothetical protein